MIIGITFSSIYQKEFNFNITVGEKVIIDNDLLKFQDIKIIEEIIGVDIAIISTGPERSQTIDRKKILGNL